MADEYIKRILAKAEFTGNFRDEYPTALIHALIDSVPAADVAPVRHGRWEWVDEEECYYRCSNCKTAAYGNTGEILSGKYCYCPNCGAKMEENK